jgi:hypothetical protein
MFDIVVKLLWYGLKMLVIFSFPGAPCEPGDPLVISQIHLVTEYLHKNGWPSIDGLISTAGTEDIKNRTKTKRTAYLINP